MEELKLKYREYYWEYEKSPFVEDEEIDKNNSARVDCSYGNAENGSNGSNGVNYVNNVGRKSEVNGCKGMAMALAKFCHIHILTDGRQKLYKPCSFSIKSSLDGEKQLRYTSVLTQHKLFYLRSSWVPSQICLNRSMRLLWTIGLYQQAMIQQLILNPLLWMCRICIPDHEKGSGS